MKILIEPANKEEIFSSVDGIILSLKGFSVQSACYYTKEEIKEIKEKYPHLEIFVNMNKNIFNKELKELEEQLKYLDQVGIQGIFFYDLAILELKNELSLQVDLVWSQTHMVNNWRTCDYYNQKGVKYALLSKEITLEEIKEIVTRSSITSMVEVISMPSVAFSRRKLISNYYEHFQKTPPKTLDILEKVSGKTYELVEEKEGCSFLQKELMNGTSIIKDLYEVNTPYIIIRAYGIEEKDLKELLEDTRKYIEGCCLDSNYIKKYQKLGEDTNFFFKQTIYQVKKNG